MKQPKDYFENQSRLGNKILLFVCLCIICYLVGSALFDAVLSNLKAMP